MSKIRESARGEDCQVRIPGWCNPDRATTVWAHANGSAAGKGIGMKAPDLLGAYACNNCHDIYDRRRPTPQGMSREEVELAFHEGHMRSLLLLMKKGIISVLHGKVKVEA